MTQDEIIKMARQTGLPSSDLYHENLEAFAKLVAAKEREACAKECDNADHLGIAALHCAKAIRARGQQ